MRADLLIRRHVRARETCRLRHGRQERGETMKLLTQEIRRKLPALGSQEEQGGRAIAWAKFFTPWAGFTWWATEFDGEDRFFGLVDGHERELGYFSLSELQNVQGPMGLAIERDLYWKPKALEEIAPEMFQEDTRKGGEDS